MLRAKEIAPWMCGHIAQNRRENRQAKNTVVADPLACTLNPRLASRLFLIVTTMRPWVQQVAPTSPWPPLALSTAW